MKLYSIIISLFLACSSFFISTSTPSTSAISFSEELILRNDDANSTLQTALEIIPLNDDIPDGN